MRARRHGTGAGRPTLSRRALERGIPDYNRLLLGSKGRLDYLLIVILKKLPDYNRMQRGKITETGGMAASPSTQGREAAAEARAALERDAREAAWDRS